jgi:hypothetical protein
MNLNAAMVQIMDIGFTRQIVGDLTRDQYHIVTALTLKQGL